MRQQDSPSLKKVILDVDTGTDDAVAIAVAVLSGKLELLGITVCHGNQPLSCTLDNTLRLVEFLKAKVPVYGGCPQPMVQYLMPGREKNVRRQAVEKIINGKTISIHQKTLPLPPATIQPESQHACSFILDTLKNAKEKITIIAVAPLTNIGMALRMDPSIAENIEEIVIMGGALQTGNRTPVAEANFYDDPEAAQIVFKSGCKLRVFTLEATQKVMCSQKEALEFAATSYVGEFVAKLTEEFINVCTLLDICDNDAVAMHDATAVCGVLQPSIVTEMHPHACDVDCSGGWSDGQLVIDRRIFSKPTDPVQIVYDVDPDACLQLMREAFSKAK